MPEQSGVEGWIKATVPKVEHPGQTPGHEARILKKVAERAGIDRDRYLQLVEGRSGEVPEEFEAKAQKLISDAEQPLVDITKYITDRGLLDKMLTDVTADIDPNDQLYLRRVRELLFDEVFNTGHEVVQGMASSPSERAKLAQLATAGALKSLTEKIDKSSVGDKFNKNYDLAHGYYSQIESAVGLQLSGEASNQVSFSNFELHNEERDRYLVDLNITSNQALVDRFCAGEKTLLFQSHEQDVVIEGGIKRGESTKKAMDDVITTVGEQTSRDYQEGRDRYFRKEVVEKTLSATQSGLIEGITVANQTFNSLRSFQETVEKTAFDKWRLPRGRFALREDQKGIESIHADTTYAGYVIGSLERGDLSDFGRMNSIKIALEGISNDQIRDQLKEKIKVAVLTSDKPEALAVVLGDKDLVAQKAGVEEYDKLSQEFSQYQLKAQEEAIQERLYQEPRISFICEDKYEGVDWQANRIANMSDYSAQRIRLEGKVAKKEVEMVLLRNMLRDSSEADRLSWKDVDKVIDMVANTGNLEDTYVKDRLIASDKLSVPQRRLAAKIMLANLFTSRRGSNDKLERVNELYAKGLITPQDIINIHNQILVAVDAGNRAFKAQNTTVDAPLMMHSFIGSIASGAGRDYFQPVVAGPLKGLNLYPGSFRIRPIRHETSQGLYYVDDRTLGERDIYTWTSSSQEDRDYTREGQQAYSSISKVLKEVRDRTDAYAAKKFDQENFDYILDQKSGALGRIKNAAGGVEGLIKLYEWGTEAQDVLRVSQEVADVIERGEIKVAGESLNRDISTVVGVLESLTSLDQELSTTRKFWEFGAKSGDKRLAEERKAEVMSRLKERGFTEGDLSAITGADLTKPEGRSVVRVQIIELVRSNKNKLSASLRKISSQVSSLPDVSVALANTRVSDEGQVTVKEVLSQPRLQPTVNKKVIDITDVRAGANQGIDFLLDEIDASEILTEPLREKINNFKGLVGMARSFSGLPQEEQEVIRSLIDDLRKELDPVSEKIRGFDKSGRQALQDRLQAVWQKRREKLQGAVFAERQESLLPQYLQEKLAA